MRLFLLAVLMFVLSGCRRDEEPAAGALRVKIFYATFHPACMKLTATDRADASRSVTTDVTVTATDRSDERTVAVFRQAGWSRDLTLTVEARERSCDGPVVASQTQEAQVPESGLAYVTLDVRAEDLDGDGFVSTANNGTDCDDGQAGVYPGATEVCDGVDNNCVAGETDAAASAAWYADLDGDGYGDPLERVFGCLQPARSVSNFADCDDTDASVHPDQEEVLCDGRDEDCDTVPDDAWPQLDSVCTTADGCAGVVACRPGGVTGSACQATQSPSAWFVDLDGDGKAGSEVRACMQPQGSVTTRADCDESSRFAFEGRAETCDFIDNNCSGAVDEGLNCGGLAWTTGEGVSGGAQYRAAAAHAVNAGWAAGMGGKLLHVVGSTPTEYTNCAGDWQSAWARPSDGRVFLGSSDGRLATTAVAGGTCDVVTTPTGASINGLVGFEGNGATTLYVAASDGRIYRWAWAPSPAAPVEVARVPANLRDIHGTSPDTLVAVGAQDFQVSELLPRIFRVTPGSNEWTLEELPASVPAGGFLRGVHVLTAQLAYAVGDDGRVLEREGTTWRLLAPPPAGGTVQPDLTGVVGFGRTAVYVSTSAGEVLRYDGVAKTWTTAATAPRSLLAIDGVDPRGISAVGNNGSFARWLP